MPSPLKGKMIQEDLSFFLFSTLISPLRVKSYRPVQILNGKQEKNKKGNIEAQETLPIFYNSYKWSINLKSCESLYCTPVTYIILYINYTSILKNLIFFPQKGKKDWGTDDSYLKNILQQRDSFKFTGFY